MTVGCDLGKPLAAWVAVYLGRAIEIDLSTAVLDPIVLIEVFHVAGTRRNIARSRTDNRGPVRRLIRRSNQGGHFHPFHFEPGGPHVGGRRSDCLFERIRLSIEGDESDSISGHNGAVVAPGFIKHSDPAALRVGTHNTREKV